MNIEQEWDAPFPALSGEEQAESDRHYRFGSSAVVRDLFSQYQNGLISAVELAHGILEEWDTFLIRESQHD